jgi:hypothetical protein
VGGVLLVCVLVVSVALLFRPDEANGYGPDARAQVVGFCTRAAPDVEARRGAGGDADDPDLACGCAYEQLARMVPWDRFVEMDEALRSGGGSTPPELADAIRACGAVPARPAVGRDQRSSPTAAPG